MNRVIKAAEEAVAIAKGEIPAGRIYHNGHWYVPQECLAKARADALEEAAKLADTWADQIWCDGEDAVLSDLARNIRAIKEKQP